MNLEIYHICTVQFSSASFYIVLMITCQIMACFELEIRAQLEQCLPRMSGFEAHDGLYNPQTL